MSREAIEEALIEAEEDVRLMEGIRLNRLEDLFREIREASSMVTEFDDGDAELGLIIEDLDWAMRAVQTAEEVLIRDRRQRMVLLHRLETEASPAVAAGVL
jgi:hypothetical protein